MNSCVNSEIKEYDKYKDSGIEWIGDIPEHWETRKWKYLFKFGKGLTITKENLQETGIPCVSYGEIHSKYPCQLRPEIHPLKCVSEDYLQGNSFSLISKGDFVFADTSEDLEGAGNFTCLLSDANIFAGYHTVVLKPFTDLTQSDYFSYFFASTPIRTQTRAKVQGIKVYSISQGILKNNSCFYPPIKEQWQIADYLDKKCGLIDESIKREKLTIQKLKEYKQSVITEAVTKGLDKNASFKPSGVEWIGDIPQHWGVRALKYILNERNQKNDPIVTEERLSLSIDKGVTLYSEKTTNLDRFKDDFTQYKVAHPNDLVINSMNVIVGAVGISKYLGCVSPAYYVLYSSDNNNFSIKYYDYIFKTSEIKRILFRLGKGVMAIDRGNDRVNTCRLKVSSYDLGRLNFTVPPFEEQQQIIDYLDKKCSGIEKTIAKKEQVIEKLTEYKKSLIYECVTGKRKVH